MRTHARHFDTCLAALAGLVLLASAGTTAQPFPDFIPLPADFGPEGHCGRKRDHVLCRISRRIHARPDSRGRLADW